MSDYCTMLKLGRMGRFGNQLFQIAGVIGIGIKNNKQFSFPKWINYDAKNKFGSKVNENIFEYFKNPLPELHPAQYKYKWIDWGYHDVVLPDGNFDLCAHFQSEKYFKHCEDVIRHYFEMKEPPGKLNIPEGSVCLHVRIGDYDLKNDYHPVQTKEFYEAACKLLPEHGNVYVFSDEPQRIKPNGRNMIVVSGNDYMTDFYNMQQCDHFVIANSTFSWWASYLGKAKNKTIIMPKLWFGSAAKISSQDIYPENAIVI